MFKNMSVIYNEDQNANLVNFNLHTFPWLKMNEVNHNSQEFNNIPNTIQIANNNHNTKKISIVMAYYNRKDLLKFTLDSIKLSKYKNFEIIIVDDGSSSEHRIDDFIELYSCFDIKLIKIDPLTKKSKNSCIPFNIGFKYVTGDIIIIQNPECCHIGDVLSYTADHLKDGEYFSYTCMAMKDIASNDTLYKYITNNNFYDRVKRYVLALAAKQKNRKCWYNHEKYRPCAYHFLSALTKNLLLKINGFDERYAFGTCYDDVEILQRIKKLQTKIIIPTISPTNDIPFCIHQWHPTRVDAYNSDLMELNKKIFYEHMKSINIDPSKIRLL